MAQANLEIVSCFVVEQAHTQSAEEEGDEEQHHCHGGCIAHVEAGEGVIVQVGDDGVRGGNHRVGAVGHERRAGVIALPGEPQSPASVPEDAVAHLDLEDAEAHGGSFDRLSIGLNWWATRRWKFGVTWGRTWLDRSDLDGTADSVLFRTQWVF